MTDKSNLQEDATEMNKFSKWTKWMVVSALALAISIPAGAASAADVKGNVYKVQYRVYNTDSNNYQSLNQWLQQYFQSYRPVYKTPTTQQPATPKAPTTPSTQQPAPKPATPSNNNGATQSSFASQVVTLVNQERAKAGLSPLSSDASLANVALVKAKDMYNNNYFDHNSPTYGSPFDMMKSFGISYRYAGENIAKGQRSPQEVMNAWMNSPGHKANILGSNFTKIGVAYYNGVWVQVFTG